LGNSCSSAAGHGGQAGGPVTGQWLSGSLSDCQNYGHVYQKISDMNRPSPANLFVFAEEHPNSINDSGLAVQIAETGPGGDYIDFPANLHLGSCSVSFADGHAIIHKWIGKILNKAPFVQNGAESAAFPTGTCSDPADLHDLNWLQSHTSSPISAEALAKFPDPMN
jgi:prepilin-type processing-associated H-X9-DG protein